MDADIAARLLDVLVAQTGGPRLAFASGPDRLEGGNSADLFSFALAGAPVELGGPLVLRVMHGDDAARNEIALHAAVAAAGFPVPRVRCSGNGSAGLGRPFMVIDRMPGKTPLDAAGVTGVPRLFRELPFLLADTMARLHSLDVAVAVAEPDGTEALLADVHDHDVGKWLRDRRPRATRTVVCHGDLHGNNLLVENGTLTAVLDWELACIGPPELDVARTRMILSLLAGISSFARRVLSRAGARSAESFTAAYERQAALDRDALAWFEVLHAARQLTVAEGSDAVARLWRPLVPALSKVVARGRSGSYR